LSFWIFQKLPTKNTNDAKAETVERVDLNALCSARSQTSVLGGNPLHLELRESA
jgi:hypothetical protein